MNSVWQRRVRGRNEKKKHYEEDLISPLELENSQQAMTNMQLEAERIHHWIAEGDVALSLADENARAGIGALRGLAPGGYQETRTIIRYHGVMPWSPAVIAKVQKFFQARFGPQLPVSVAGQSLTHDRLGYDHREAVDVAVSPDSREGRGLMKYLRQARIPFLAFRGKVPGVSTGPHIHIGLPSPRLHLLEPISAALSPSSRQATTTAELLNLQFRSSAHFSVT
jgi:hypothetical protein